MEHRCKTLELEKKLASRANGGSASMSNRNTSATSIGCTRIAAAENGRQGIDEHESHCIPASESSLARKSPRPATGRSTLQSGTNTQGDATLNTRIRLLKMASGNANLNYPPKS